MQLEIGQLVVMGDGLVVSGPWIFQNYQTHDGLTDQYKSELGLLTRVWTLNPSMSKLGLELRASGMSDGLKEWGPGL